MSMNSIGDLAQHFLLRRQNAALKSQLNQLTQELSTGRKTDVADAVTGDYAFLSDIERSLQVLSGFKASVNEAKVFADTTQDVLGNIQSIAGDLGTAALTAGASHLPSALATTSERAKQDFSAIVAGLNSSVAGRAQFSGTQTDTAALANSDDMLDQIRLAVAGTTSVSAVTQAVNDWFMAPGGGFETLGYLGSVDDLSPFQLGEHNEINLSIRADNAALRTTLRDTALVALVYDTSLALDLPTRRGVIQAAAEGLMTGQSGLTNLRSSLGFAQERIEDATVRNSTTQSGLEVAKSELLSADPYETATRLENVQLQLESLYAVTARMSRMTLMDYLR